MFRRIRSLVSQSMSTQLVLRANCSIEILNACEMFIKEYEDLLSAYITRSDIVRINKQAGVQAVECDERTIEAIKEAIEIAQATHGSFDPTIGALSHFGYGFGFEHAHILEVKKAEALATHVDHKKISIEENHVALQKGMALDLGGSAKGFVAQKALEFLYDQGATKIMVSIGGEIACVGKSWKIGIADPNRSRLFALITTHKTFFAISSSGTYERFIGSQMHHHILNPKTGVSKNALGSLTLISTLTSLGKLDALNTALFGDQLLEKTLGNRYRFESLSIDEKGDHRVSEGFKTLVKGFKLF